MVAYMVAYLLKRHPTLPPAGRSSWRRPDPSARWVVLALRLRAGFEGLTQWGASEVCAHVRDREYLWANTVMRVASHGANGGGRIASCHPSCSMHDGRQLCGCWGLETVSRTAVRKSEEAYRSRGLGNFSVTRQLFVALVGA
eukprot:6682627-Prymnesium_polylepis.1